MLIDNKAAFTISELEALDLQPPRLLTTEPLRIVSESLTIVHGDPGVGKTWALLATCVAAAAAGARVLLLEGEGSLWGLRDRLHRVMRGLGVSASNLPGLVISRTAAFLDPSELLALIEAHAPEILVVDPISAFFAGNENAVEDVREFLGFFAPLTAGGMAVVLAHHNRKSQPGQGGGLRGSTAFLATADGATSFTSRSSGTVVIHHYKTREAEPFRRAYSLEIGDNVARFVVTAEPPGAGVRGGTRAREIENALRAAPGGLTQTELREKVGMSGAACAKAVAELRALGLVGAITCTRRNAKGRERRVQCLVWRTDGQMPSTSPSA